MKPSHFVALLATALTGSAILWAIVYWAIQADLFQILKRNWAEWTIAAIFGFFIFTFILRRHGYDIGE